MTELGIYIAIREKGEWVTASVASVHGETPVEILRARSGCLRTAGNFELFQQMARNTMTEFIRAEFGKEPKFEIREPTDPETN